MAKVSEQEIRLARRIGVLDYLRKFEPGELVRVSRTDYCTRSHDSLIISENGLFHWFSVGVGGNNAIDYLLKVKKMDFVSAVRLLNEYAPLHSSFQPVNFHVRIEEQKELVCPVPDSSNEAIKAYLFRRGICSKVFRFCNDNGLLYQTTRGGYKNCVFVGMNENGQPKSAFIRGCNSTWRGDAEGSQKKYGFCIPAEDPVCDTVEVYEAPIDAMSGATLRHLHKKEPWRGIHYLAIGGLNYQPVDWFLDHHAIKTVRLCLDNDQRGRAFSGKLAEKLKSNGYLVEDVPPTYGKDYNDQLVHELQIRFRQAER